MSEKAGRADQGPGSGAAKPVTEPPGGEVDEALNEGPDDPGVTKGSRDPRTPGSEQEPDEDPDDEQPENPSLA